MIRVRRIATAAAISTVALAAFVLTARWGWIPRPMVALADTVLLHAAPVAVVMLVMIGLGRGARRLTRRNPRR